MEQRVTGDVLGKPIEWAGILPERRARQAGFAFDRTMIFLLTAIAAVPAFWKLGARSLWQDESTTAGIVALPWRSFWHVVVTREANMGLYYFTLKILRVFGTSESALRGLSAVAMVATIPIVYRLAVRLFNSRAAVAAAIILETNAFFAGFGREARSYELVMFLSAASSLLFVQIMQDGPTRRRWVAYVAVSALALYAHFFAVFVLIAHGLIAMITARGPLRRRLLASLAVTGVLCAPLAFDMLGHDVGQVSWIPKPAWGQISGVLLEFTGGDLLHLSLFAAALLVMTTVFFSRSFERPDRTAALFVVALIAIPLGVSFAMSYVKPIFLSRYLIVCIPPLALAAGAGISRIRSTIWFVVALALFASLTLTGAKRYQPSQEDWRSAAAILATHAHVGDAVVFNSPWTRWGFDYYLPRYGMRMASLHMLYPDPSWTVFGPDRTLPGPQWDQVVRDAAAYPQLWIVVRSWEQMPWSLTLALRKSYQQIEDYQSANVEVKLFTKRSS